MSFNENSTLATTGTERYFIDRGETAPPQASGIPGKAVEKPALSTKTGDGVGGIVFEPSRRTKGSGKLDAALIDRATELLDEIEYASPEQKSLAIESLRCVTCELWPSAAAASQYHQSLLALVEGMLLAHEDLNANQAAALRGAVKDLSSKSLNENYLDVLRSRFVDEGYNPLAMLSGMETDDDRGEHDQR